MMIRLIVRDAHTQATRFSAISRHRADRRICTLIVLHTRHCGDDVRGPDQAREVETGQLNFALHGTVPRDTRDGKFRTAANIEVVTFPTRAQVRRD